MKQESLLFQNLKLEVFKKLSELNATKLILAVSGGVDSMLLLEFFNELTKESDLELTVAHVDHKLRNTSLRDAEYVRTRANDLGLNFSLASADSGPGNENMESWARELRYSSLESFRKEQKADLVVTAHHASDQVETHLMKLLSANLSRDSHCINQVDLRRRVYRPFLGLYRGEILSLAKWRGTYLGRG